VFDAETERAVASRPAAVHPVAGGGHG